MSSELLMASVAAQRLKREPVLPSVLLDLDVGDTLQQTEKLESSAGKPGNDLLTKKLPVASR